MRREEVQSMTQVHTVLCVFSTYEARDDGYDFSTLEVTSIPIVTTRVCNRSIPEPMSHSQKSAGPFRGVQDRTYSPWIEYGAISGATSAVSMIGTFLPGNARTQKWEELTCISWHVLADHSLSSDFATNRSNKKWYVTEIQKYIPLPHTSPHGNYFYLHSTALAHIIVIMNTGRAGWSVGMVKCLWHFDRQTHYCEHYCANTTATANTTARKRTREVPCR